MGETTGENHQPILPGSCGCREEEALIKAALNCNQELIVDIPGIIGASHWYAVLALGCIYNNISNLKVFHLKFVLQCVK